MGVTRQTGAITSAWLAGAPSLTLGGFSALSRTLALSLWPRVCSSTSAVLNFERCYHARSYDRGILHKGSRPLATALSHSGDHSPKNHASIRGNRCQAPRGERRYRAPPGGRGRLQGRLAGKAPGRRLSRAPSFPPCSKLARPAPMRSPMTALPPAPASWRPTLSTSARSKELPHRLGAELG
jgi:hypothetical protein